MDEKAIYDQAGQLNRYFLNWRQGLLAGYFAVLYGTMSLVISACQNGSSGLASKILAAAGFIGIAFALIEWRNRECYHRAGKLAQSIEEGAKTLKLKSLYAAMDVPPKYWPRKIFGLTVMGPHSAAILSIYLGFSTAFFYAAYIDPGMGCGK